MAIHKSITPQAWTWVYWTMVLVDAESSSQLRDALELCTSGVVASRATNRGNTKVS
jgi:hypothetical protein